MGALNPLWCGVWVHQSETFATNSGVVIDGSDALLIDPGLTPEDLGRIRSLLRQRRATVRFVILTHGHWDHLLGPAYFPDCEVIVQHSYLRMIGEHRRDLMRQVARWQVEGGFLSANEFEPPRPTVIFDRRAVLYLVSRKFVLIHAPGHAPDQCAVFLPEAGLLWAGDMLSDREPPMVMDSVSRYMRTLRHLRALPVRALVPGHGAPTGDPCVIRRRFDQDLAYLDSLWRCVTCQVARGRSCDETMMACRDVRFVQPDSYPNAHEWNIESAYVAAGGMTDGGLSGWEKDWL